MTVPMSRKNEDDELDVDVNLARRSARARASARTRMLILAAMVVMASVSMRAAAAAPAAPVPAAVGEGARRDQAKAAFNEGNTAYNLGKYQEAIAHFERAYGLSRVPEILFNLGQCYRKLWENDERKKSDLGRRALHYYQALAREAPGSRVRADADQFIAELEPAVALAEVKERQGQIDAARGGEALRLAQTFLRDGQFADAATTADRLLREPDNGRELLAEAYVVRGRAAAGLGDPLGAEAQFRRALELRPSAELTDARPPETAAFEAARRSAKGGGLRLVQAPIGEVPPGKPSPIAVGVEGDSEQMVSALELGYRRLDGGAFVTTRVPYGPAGASDGTARPPGTDTARQGAPPPRPPGLAIPAAALQSGGRVEYYVRALDTHGGVLAESGTPALPFRLQVAAPAVALLGGGASARDAGGGPGRTSWYKRWWVWTIVGAVAIGTGTAAYVGTRGDGLPRYDVGTKQ